MARQEINSQTLCPHCNQANLPDARFCSYCGAQLSGGEIEIMGEYEPAFVAHAEKFKQKYQIQKKIGEGGMSTVYKAIQLNIQKIIAIKVLKPNFIENTAAIKQFHEEARNAGALIHPNIITIYDEGEIDGIHYIAMEYLDGDDFHSYIYKNGPVPEDQAKIIFIKLADALQHLEKNNLIHKDVKSANIFITRTGEPVLMDFGIATDSFSQSTDLYETNFGTPEYMSPEQITGVNSDPRSDLFSLGIVMYEALSGRLPFKGTTYTETLNLIQSGEPNRDILKEMGISSLTEEVILKLMQKNPDDRFQHAQEVINALTQKVKPSFMFKQKVLMTGVYSLAGIIFISLIAISHPWTYFEKSEKIFISPNSQKNSGINNQQIIRNTNTQNPVTEFTDSTNTGQKTQTPNAQSRPLAPFESNRPIGPSKPNAPLTKHPGLYTEDPSYADSTMATPAVKRPKRIPFKDNSGSTLVKKGDEYYEKGDYQKAATYYQQAAEVDPNNEYYKLRQKEANQKQQSENSEGK